MSNASERNHVIICKDNKNTFDKTQNWFKCFKIK